MRQKILNIKFTILGRPLALKNILLHPMFAGSAVMIIGSNIANFIASIYHFVIGRMLSPDQYGELAAAITFISLAITSLSFLSTVVVKFISSARKKEQKNIVSWFFIVSFCIGIFATILFLILAPLTSNFFNMQISIMYIAAPVVGVFIISMTLKSILQGLLMFTANVLSTNVQIAMRLILGVFAIYLGWGVWGALLGFLIAVILEVLIVIYYLRNVLILQFNIKLKNKLSIFRYAFPVLLSTLSVNALISTDVLLAKRYLSPFDAGIYASLSTLGRIIFFGTAPIMSVMFPLLAKKHAEGKNPNNIFWLSILMTFLICFFIFFVYLFFPKIVINILYGEKYLAASSLLYFFGVFISVYTIGNLVLNYYLSQGVTIVVLIPIVSALVQYFLIQVYNDSIFSIVLMSIISVLIMTVGLFLYLILDKLKLNKNKNEK